MDDLPKSPRLSPLLRTRGARVKVTDEKGNLLTTGWLVGETYEGLLVALDEGLADIRLISNAQGISYNYENANPRLTVPNAAEVEAELENANEALHDAARRALARLNYQEMRAFTDQAGAFTGRDSECRLRPA